MSPPPPSTQRLPADSMILTKLGPSAADIQNHLYASFLHKNTADVALRVHGTWDAVYSLHRVVLIQSGFFRSLFTAGFLESAPRLGNHTGPEEIVMRFDDPNITRAAFEVCVSRLYGGGPTLDISPFLIPSSSHPLTPSFPRRQPPHKAPPDHHPATPRFLLSLLATAVYLSIPSLASQALSSILSTVGPYTVVKYLNFALGRHIGHLDLEPDEPEAAVGLEQVAHITEENKSIAGSVKSMNSNLLLDDSLIKKESGLETQNSLLSALRAESEEEQFEPSIHYGGISNKIGEACACWLARWGTDILAYEEKDPATMAHESPPASRKRSKTVPIISSQEENDSQLPKVWLTGGLDAKWVRAIISANTFFVKDERARYAFACRVVEHRRKAGIIEAEEQEWTKLFEQGIYYANMTMEDMMQISQDISPTTKLPFVTLATLQRANWYQSILRNCITVRSPTTIISLSESASNHRAKDLALTQTTADIVASMSLSDKDAVSKVYFPIPTDSSIRIGDGGNNVTNESNSNSMDRLFASTSNLSPPSSSPTLKPVDSTAIFVTSESDFFGLLPPRPTAVSIVACDPTGKSRWTPFPPYRFAVEFWDLGSLKEKSRLHSHTICYAGSLFNIYVQAVTKKGQTQLGIYLHRQSSIDPIPPASAPASVVAAMSQYKNERSRDTSPQRQLQYRGPSTPPTSHYSPSIYPMAPRMGTPPSRPSTAPHNPGTSPSISHSPPSPRPLSANNTATLTLPATSPPVMPPQPFRDPRPAISAYFTISCASGTGSSQTRFTSSPDVFSVSQSWGWKSTSLMMEGVGQGDAVGAGRSGSGNPLVSLRATVVLGLV